MRVADLTIEEFQDLLQLTLRELVEEVIEEKLGMLNDPDEGLKLRPEVEASLEDYLDSDRRGDDAKRLT